MTSAISFATFELPQLRSLYHCALVRSLPEPCARPVPPREGVRDVTHAAVSKRQRIRAKNLRQTMTRAETLLWRYLKAHHVNGLGFRRQVPMRSYIADFVCHSARLIVELDGETHDFDSRMQRDQKRDAWFASQGYLVLRFTNDDVMTNLEGVVEAIRAAASAHS
ncbi:MAG: endonuclease domain-containing protein [Xanthobacteraceae bacterium]